MSKLKQSFFWIVGIAAIVVVSCTSGGKKSPGNVEAVVAAVTSFPMPDPFVFPASPKNSNFHEISWEYFLWLTDKIKPGKLRFETMFTDKAINPKFKNDTHHVLGGVQQAGSEGIVVDQNGRAVYTTMIIDTLYRDFVLDNALYNPDSLLAFNPKESFPIGTISMKAAWKIVEEGMDVSSFYTRKASVKQLMMFKGDLMIPENPTIKNDVEVALVGFHIAVVVNHHPEAIWATFEHVDNAPSFGHNQKPNDPVSEKTFTFYKGGTLANQTNVNAYPILSFDSTTQIINPVTQVARQYSHGGGDTENKNSINTVNTSFHEKLDENSIWKNYYEVGAIWFNKNDALIPDWSPAINAKILTGSTTLSNSVIETFTQNVVTENNCFSCHNTMPLTFVGENKEPVPGKNVLTSHIILKEYLEGLSVKRN